MKLALLFVSVCLSTAVLSQEDQQEKINLPPRQQIRFAPFAMLVGPVKLTSEYRLGYEHVLGSRQSIVLSGSYLGNSPFQKNLDNELFLSKSEGFRAQMTYRFYRTKTEYAPFGFFLGPHISYTYHEIVKSKGLYQHREFLSYSNAAIILGFQVPANNHISFELHTGVGLKYNLRRQKDSFLGSIESTHIGPKFYLGFSTGFVL